MFAQANPGEPVQLRGPRRSGGFGGGGNGFGAGGNGFSPNAPGNGFYAGRGADGFGFNTNLAPNPPAPSVSMFVDGLFLFILRGDTLMQFDKKTLRLLNSVELPRPTASAPTGGELKSHTAPPLRPGGLRVEPDFKKPDLDPTARYNFNTGPTF